MFKFSKAPPPSLPPRLALCVPEMVQRADNPGEFYAVVRASEDRVLFIDASGRMTHCDPEYVLANYERAQRGTCTVTFDVKEAL